MICSICVIVLFILANIHFDTSNYFSPNQYGSIGDINDIANDERVLKLNLMNHIVYICYLMTIFIFASFVEKELMYVFELIKFKRSIKD